MAMIENAPARDGNAAPVGLDGGLAMSVFLIVIFADS
jgi:hypothetical protein